MTNLGLHGTALDADLTREELEQTVAEIQRRLRPSYLRQTFVASFRRRPAPFIAGGVSLVAGVAALVMLAVRRG
jgi:hypothetical protein